MAPRPRSGGGSGANAALVVAIVGLTVVLFVAIVVTTRVLIGQHGEAPPEGVSQALTVSSRLLSFGFLTVDSSVVRRLVLRNDGPGRLHARFVVEAPIYSVDPEELELHPGQVERITITVRPREAGSLRHYLQIYVEGVTHDTLKVGLVGRVGVQVAEATTAGVELNGDADGQGRETAASRAPVSPLRGRAVDDSAATDETASGSDGDAEESAESDRSASTQSATESARGHAASSSRSSSVLSASLGRVTVLPYDPATSAPVSSLAEPAMPIPESISAEEAATASPITGKTPGRKELPDRLPDDLKKDDPLGNDPIVSPMFTVSALSTLTLIGSTVQFYSQDIGVLGTGNGGPFGLMQPLDFPLVPLAFGESMLFAPSALASGTFDATTGGVTLAIALDAVDSEGFAAPVVLSMTTGTTVARNDEGIVVSLTGSPRDPASGLLKLVGIGKIPVGYRNAAENHTVFCEILATLQFGNPLAELAAPGVRMVAVNSSWE